MDIVKVNNNTKATYRMVADPQLLNALGVFHSGAFATLVDVSVMIACRAVTPHTKKIVTAHLTMDLLKVVRPKEELRIEILVHKTGKFLNFGDAHFFNEKEELVAKGMIVGSCVYSKQERAAMEQQEQQQPTKAPPEL